MTADEVDAYLAGLEEPKRSTLEALRRSIRAVVPDAEECISYGMPAFRVGGKVVAGFAAFKNHLAYLPHSGEVLEVWATASRDMSARRARCTSRSTNRCRMTWFAASCRRSSKSSDAEPSSRCLHATAQQHVRIAALCG